MMDASTTQMLTDSVRVLLAEPDVDVSSALDELGWAEVVADDEATAVTVLFQEHGKALARSTALDRVVLGELGEVLPTGAKNRSVLYPTPGGSSADGDRLAGVLLAEPSGTAEIVIPYPGGVALVESRDVTATVVSAFDSLGRWCSVQVDAPIHALPGAAAAWPPAEAAGRRALAAELNGVTREILTIVLEHTSQRVQYGRPIAGYQTVRHRLAEGHAMLTASVDLLADAWTDRSEWAAMAAKAQAGQAYLDVSRHAMQLCGAIGLTAEHRLHHYVERGAVLDALLGSTRELQREMGARLLDGFTPGPVVNL